MFFFCDWEKIFGTISYTKIFFSLERLNVSSDILSVVKTNHNNPTFQVTRRDKLSASLLQTLAGAKVALSAHTFSSWLCTQCFMIFELGTATVDIPSVSMDGTSGNFIVTIAALKFPVETGYLELANSVWKILDLPTRHVRAAQQFQCLY